MLNHRFRDRDFFPAFINDSRAIKFVRRIISQISVSEIIYDSHVPSLAKILMAGYVC